MPLPPLSVAFPWYAIRTKSNHEKVTATVLASHGLKPYVPTYRSRRRWTDRVVESELPLFPGYVFCRFDPLKRLPIIKTPGVVSIVGFGNEPAPIDDSEISAIQAIQQSGALTEPCPFLRDGERVRVIVGSMQGTEGILLRKKTEWRMVVSLSLLQRSVSVEIDREWITPA